MSDSEKKDIKLHQRKIAELLLEKQKLEEKVTGLLHQKSELEKENETFKITTKNQAEELKRQRNIIGSLETKVDMKNYLVEESEKEKKTLQMEKDHLIK